MASLNKDRCWYREAPPGFMVLRESEVKEGGRADRWLCRGTLLGRRVVRSGLRSRGAACRAAWFAYDDAATLGHLPPFEEELAEADVLIANRQAARFEAWAKRLAGNPKMALRYTVRLDSWDHMMGALLAELIRDAGSIRKTAKVIDVPRSSLGRWVLNHQERGTWPE